MAQPFRITPIIVDDAVERKDKLCPKDLEKLPTDKKLVKKWEELVDSFKNTSNKKESNENK